MGIHCGGDSRSSPPGPFFSFTAKILHLPPAALRRASPRAPPAGNEKGDHPSPARERNIWRRSRRPVDPDGQSLGEVNEGEDERLIGLRQFPPVTQHQMVQEDGHLQLRQLRPRAEPRASPERHEIGPRRRSAAAVPPLLPKQGGTVISKRSD